MFFLFLNLNFCAGILSDEFVLHEPVRRTSLHFSKRSRIRREVPLCFMQGTAKSKVTKSSEFNEYKTSMLKSKDIKSTKKLIKNKRLSQLLPASFPSPLSTIDPIKRKSPNIAHAPHGMKGHNNAMNKLKNMAVAASDSFEVMMDNRTDFEMAATSALALSLPTGVIITLAMNGDSPMESSETFVRDLTQLWNDFSMGDGQDFAEVISADGLELFEDGVQSIGKVSFNVFDAAVPTTAVDVLSIALGEAIAGFIGGLATYSVAILLRAKGFRENIVQKLEQDYDKKKSEISFNNLFSAGQDSDNSMTNGLVTEAVADTDYFLTRAAATPLLGAFGLSPGAASLISVFVASVPYQFIKISRRQRENREREDRLLKSLLANEKLKKKPLYRFFRIKPPVDLDLVSINGRTIDSSIQTTTDLAKEFNTGAANKIDLVELFADITKWLEYDVLSNDFAGSLKWHHNPINSGVESAAFGFMSALSSQLYADVIYRNTDYGLKTNRLASRARSLQDTLSLYSIKCLSAATLFGTYETVRLPISSFITNLLSGGVDSCLGSKDFNLCLETYMFDNPAEASTEAQLRSLIVAGMNLIDRVNLDMSNENVNMLELGRSLSVQLYSIFLRYS